MYNNPYTGNYSMNNQPYMGQPYYNGMQQNNGFSQPMPQIQQQQQQTQGMNGVKVRPVASFDEAKAIPTDFLGNILLLTDFSHGMIYFKALDTNTGNAIFHIYKRAAENPEISVAPEPAYDAKKEIEALKIDIQNLKKELGIDSQAVTGNDK